MVFSVIVGCTSNTPASSQPAPQVTITSPADSASVPAGDITVSIQVANFNIVDKQGQANAAGEGHIHFYLDVNPVPTDPGKPAIPADAKAVWAHVSGTNYMFMGVSPGTHTIAVELVNNDHTPLQPAVVRSITVTATGSAAPPSPTPSPTPSVIPSATPTAATSGSGSTVPITLVAANIAFDQSTITVPAGSHVVMTFRNQDSGVSHNFALYTDSSARTKIFVGDFITGPGTLTYTFDAPSAPGTYFFRCDVHPTVMYGTFVVR